MLLENVKIILHIAVKYNLARRIHEAEKHGAGV